MTDEKKILFVRSAGGMPGLDIHMGIWLALHERGIRSTANAGTSAGAIVAACDSADEGPSRYHAILHLLDDDDVRCERFLWQLRFYLDYFLSPDPIVELLGRMFPSGVSGVKKQLTLWATRERYSVAWRFDYPRIKMDEAFIPLREVILASMSIAGVFPKVEFGIWPRVYFSDGGTTNYLGLPPEWKAYDEVWALVASPPTEYKPKRECILSRMLFNSHMLMRAQLDKALLDLRTQSHFHAPKVYVIRPTCGADCGTLRFDHDLISQAAAQAGAQIDKQLEDKPA